MQAVGDRQQAGSHVDRVAVAQITQSRVATLGPPGPHPDLGETKDPSQKRLHQIHRLRSGKRHLQRLAADQPGLHTQSVAVDPPAGDRPGDDTA